MRISKYSLVVLALAFSSMAANIPPQDSQAPAEVGDGKDPASRIQTQNPDLDWDPEIDEEGVIPGVYVVKLEDEGDLEAMYKELQEEGMDIQPRLKFEKLQAGSFQVTNGNGSAYSNPENVQRAISKSSHVKKVWPVREFEPTEFKMAFSGPIDDIAGRERRHERRQDPEEPEEHKKEYYAYPPHVMTGMDKLHMVGAKGDGLVVGIISTGVDLGHPRLSRCSDTRGQPHLPKCVITRGYDFTKPRPEDGPPDFTDNIGLGTAIAGVVAAQENDAGFVGVAPAAELAVYKVEDRGFQANDEIIVAAINRAIEDSVSVITGSFGGPGGGLTEVSNHLITWAIEQWDISVFLGAGDSGLNEAWTAKPLDSEPNIFRVGSVQTPGPYYKVLQGKWKLDSRIRLDDFGYWRGTPTWTDGIQKRLWMPQNPYHACGDLPFYDSSQSRVVLLRETDECSLDVQARNVAKAGIDFIIFAPKEKR